MKIVKWNQLCYKTIDFWRQQNQSIFRSSILRRDLGFHREMMGLEGGVYLYHRMTPPTNLGHSWVIFEGWSQILPSTKLFRHEFEQGCSAMATQKLEEKVQQHDAVVESSKTGCRGQSRAHGKAYEQVPALICDTYARRILCAATVWGGYFAHREQKKPPKYFTKSEIPHLNFTHPPIISAFNTK